MQNKPKLFETLSSFMVSGIEDNYKSILNKSMIYYEDRRKEGFKEFTRHLLKGTAEKGKIECKNILIILTLITSSFSLVLIKSINYLCIEDKLIGVNW